MDKDKVLIVKWEKKKKSFISFHHENYSIYYHRYHQIFSIFMPLNLPAWEAEQKDAHIYKEPKLKSTVTL